MIIIALCLLGGAVLSVQAATIPSGPLGVYGEVAKGQRLDAEDLSEYVSGFLGNVKNYRVYNLNGVRSRAGRGQGDRARERAASLGVEWLLRVRAETFDRRAGKIKLVLQLERVGAPKVLDQWSALVEVPYFDPPWFGRARPYGNLDQVFAQWPEQEYATPLVRRLLVACDQDMDEGDGQVRRYLADQLATASRIMAREFGIRLEVKDMVHWEPSYRKLPAIARAAVSLPGRDQVDLTLVSLGPPAPMAQWNGPRTLGYARVLTNVLVTREMNAHVFVHEIAHVLGAIHIDAPGRIMHPILARRRLGGRFRILPNIRFSAVNRQIVDMAKTLTLGARFAEHQDKLEQLAATYAGLRQDYLEEVAPYYAQVLIHLDRVDEAVEVLRAALGPGVGHEGVRAMLVEALHLAGRYAEARAFSSDQDEGMAEIHLSASMVFFGEVEVGRERRGNLTISNLGGQALVLQRIDVPRGVFYLEGSFEGQTLVEPGASLEVELSFRPDGRGPHQDVCEIVSNAEGKRLVTVRLKGWGTE